MDLLIKICLLIIALPFILMILAFFLPLILILIILSLFIPSVRSYTRARNFQRRPKETHEDVGDVCDVECTVLDSTVVDETDGTRKDLHTIDNTKDDN